MISFADVVLLQSIIFSLHLILQFSNVAISLHF